MGSNQRGNISSPTEHVGTRAGTAATPAQLRVKTTSEENKQFDPDGKGERASLWNAAVILSFFSLGRLWAIGGSMVLIRVFLPCVFLPVLYLLFLSGDYFSAS